MLAQLPSNMLITRLRPSLYLPIAAFIWSGISAATFACVNAEGLWALQFVLGIAEAPLFPGAVFLMSCWYTRREFALRVALLYSGLVLAQAFSGLIAAGVFGGMDGAMGKSHQYTSPVITALTDHYTCRSCWLAMAFYNVFQPQSNPANVLEANEILVRAPCLHFSP